MNVRSRLGLLAVTTTLTAAGALTVAVSSASAEQACQANITCVYAGGVGHDGGSYEVQLGTRSPGTGLANISESNRNRLSSWKNRSNTGARFYYDTTQNGLGTCVSMRAFSQASASVGNPDDNQAEAHAYNRAC